MDLFTFIVIIIAIVVCGRVARGAIHAWKAVRLADAANLRAAVETVRESDEPLGEVVIVPGGRTH